jgi:cysteine desulfurase
MSAYLDHAATTPLCPEALAAMLAFLGADYGNPSGVHTMARRARQAVDDGRETMAALLDAPPGDVIFTAGGSEADNLAVVGAHARRGGRVVCSAVEHHAVLEPCRALGCEVVPVRTDGTIDLDRLEAALDPGVSVVSVMAANNEVGVVQPLAEVAALVRDRAPDAVLHTDAVQAFPWLDVGRLTAGFDLVSVSAHKFGGPKGVGALAVRHQVELDPLIRGGGQERGRRAGTHNVAGIAGMAAAAAATDAGRATTVARVAALRDRLADGLLEAVSGALETGRRETKVAGNCHLLFPGVESEALLVLLDESGVWASAGSACASGALDPSHVLLAMGLDRGEAASSIRFSLGSTTTDEEVDLALQVVPKAVARLRG